MWMLNPSPMMCRVARADGRGVVHLVRGAVNLWLCYSAAPANHGAGGGWWKGTGGRATLHRCYYGHGVSDNVMNLSCC